ncbi:hypothetical protein FB451DRAFT_1555568, partial [Mycena latifolia]
MAVLCKGLPNWSRRQIGIPAITDPSTWARCFRVYSVFINAPNDIFLAPAKEKQLHVFAALRTISTFLKPTTEKQLHDRTRITHPRREIAEARYHFLGGRHPHKKAPPEASSPMPTRRSRRPPGLSP